MPLVSVDHIWYVSPASSDCRRDLCQHMAGCQGTWAKLFMDKMWYLDASLWGREAFRSPSNTHPSLTLISQRPPFLSICVCDSETACDQLLGGVYMCLCECLCVRDMLFSPQSYDKCSTLSSHHGADVPLGRSHTHTHTQSGSVSRLNSWLGCLAMVSLLTPLLTWQPQRCQKPKAVPS